MWKYRTQIPNSVYRSLFLAAVLPDPYKGTNSRKYQWVDEKIWYYRKRFTLSKPCFAGNAFLCFDGVAYYSRVWINGTLLGSHEGMFGGPCYDVADLLNYEGENEIQVEVKACNYGIKDSFDNRKKPMHQIVPWNLVRDRRTSNGDFIVVGIWNHVRLEFTESFHINRPYLFTKSADPQRAVLSLELEIADGTQRELKPFYGYQDRCSSYTRAYDSGLTGSTLEKTAEIHIHIKEKDSGKIVYRSADVVPFTDFPGLMMDEKYRELQFFTKEIEISSPRLWYPVGLGNPFLYLVEITMSVDDRLCDRISFQTGIRTFDAMRTAGRKYRTRWENFHFAINGTPFFLMGVNWMPIDFLYDISPSEYEWCLMMAKNAGIQMIRVWSGGGMPETDYFYDLCDQLGIMVWQDHMIANTCETYNYDQEVLESQEAYNLYRIRNHPSLVLHCGGNEFNPYHTGNAASMFVISRIIKDLDPSRLFHYTTADRGSAHVYRDIEPAWFHHLYKQLPFLAETGIHNFPTFVTMQQVICRKECSGILPSLTSEAFQKGYPELLNHFTEYTPIHVSRMLSRISQIGDVRKFTLEDMCEAAQVQAYEFYTLVIQAMRENYPVCGGILPWVFKRHWPTVGAQLIDGMGRPTYPYYALQNAYRSVSICLCLNWSVIAPMESVPLRVKLFNQNHVILDGGVVSLTVYAPDMTIAKEYTCTVSGNEDTCTFDDFLPDARFTDTCFLICADLHLDGEAISRSSYFIKCTSRLSDGAFYKQYRSFPSENLFFSDGPWLKEGLKSAKEAAVTASLLGSGIQGSYPFFKVCVRNTSSVAAYPVTLEIENTSARFYASENFFLLKPGESRSIRLVCDGLSAEELATISISAWNANRFIIKAKKPQNPIAELSRSRFPLQGPELPLPTRD